MDIAVVIDGIDISVIKSHPFIYFKDRLAEKNIHIHIFWEHENQEAFKRPYDAMLLFVWQHWLNPTMFNQYRAMKVMEKYATYRAEYPKTVQIILNHTDNSRHPFALPFWRVGDPILYRTPPYDRKELYPFPEDKIWAYEMVWGSACFIASDSQKYSAGFIGSASGTTGYREAVARETAKVGIGLCQDVRPYPSSEYNHIMSRCQIAVCPRGWGQQSLRHWDSWLSGKPVLTDRDCDSVEMIPGQRLREGVHYLVYDDPKEIPDIVSDWTRKSRLEELERIGQNGKRAALSYNAFGRIVEFFERNVKINED